MRTSAKFHQLLLIASTLALSWLAMQIVHESGHICGAYFTGGSVSRVLLHPLAFSRTDFAQNPHPLIVAWCGPLLGTLLPLAGFALARSVRLPGWYVLRFFAGFCLIANGAYLGVGSFQKAGDAGDLLRDGVPIWTLWLFGLMAMPLGLYLWHHLGRHFGLGPNPAEISPAVTWLTTAILLAIIAAELSLSSSP